MRPRFLLMLGLGVAAIVAVLFIVRSATVQSEMHPSKAGYQEDDRVASKSAALSPSTEGPTAVAPLSVRQTGSVEDAATKSGLDAIFAEASDPEFARHRAEQMKVDPLFDWKQPINFYGKVVDENGDPVGMAIVECVWNDLSPEGTSKATLTTDPTGVFALLEKTGKRLYLTVTKEGYYSAGISRMAVYEYASPFEGRFVPDPNNPVVFTLRKKGSGTELVTSRRGIKESFGVELPLDGSPVAVDLLTRQSGRGPLILRQIKPAYTNWREADSWSLTLEIPDGGFVAHQDEFPFEAPASGYEPVVHFVPRKSEPTWTTRVKGDFYIRFGNPPLYGWLQVVTDITHDTVGLRYAINPDGSRYLEPK